MQDTCYETAIIGSSALGLGCLLSRPENSILIEASASICPEWSQSFYPGTDWDTWDTCDNLQPTAAALLAELRQRQVLTGHGLQVSALAAQCFKALRDSTANYRFLSVVTAVEDAGDCYSIHILNAGGHQQLRARQIIDTTDEAVTLPQQAVSVQSRAVGMQLQIGGEPMAATAVTDAYHLHPGAFASEATLQYHVAPDTDWITARRQLHDFWINRPSELRAWNCVSVATRFSQRVTALGSIKENWHHLPGCNTANAIQAFNQGICAAQSMEVLA